MSKEKKAVVQQEVASEAVVRKDDEQMLLPLATAIAGLDAKKAVVHEDEVAAIKDSRKRDLPLFKATNDDCDMWELLHDAARFVDKDIELYRKITDALDAGYASVWVVAVSGHQAKLALIGRVWPMEKCSKKDRDYRYLHLLESAAKTQVATS